MLTPPHPRRCFVHEISSGEIRLLYKGERAGDHEFGPPHSSMDYTQFSANSVVEIALEHSLAGCDWYDHIHCDLHVELCLVVGASHIEVYLERKMYADDESDELGEYGLTTLLEMLFI